MADSNYKIENLDSYKVGGGECEIYLGDVKLYPLDSPVPPTPHDYSSDYLTITALGDGEISWRGNQNTSNKLSYSTDSGQTWTTPYSSIFSVNVQRGDKVLFKGNCTVPYSNDGIGVFRSSVYPQNLNFNVEGNVMSLLYGDDFSGQTSITSMTHTFQSLFSGSSVVDAENLVLPATALSRCCYHGMFSNCTSLTKAPSVLPADTLEFQCYLYMFSGCTSLVQPPQLQASTMADSSCAFMFVGCTSLQTAPQLSATTLAEECYNYMFMNCTSLTTAPALPATTLEHACYQDMFYNCTSLTTAPTLPAPILADYCYASMFLNCYNLSSITCLATDISAENCTNGWVISVSSSGTFTKDPNMTDWTRDTNGIPSNWTIQNYS